MNQFHGYEGGFRRRYATRLVLSHSQPLKRLANFNHRYAMKLAKFKHRYAIKKRG
jgi:hypothetical protein